MRRMAAAAGAVLLGLFLAVALPGCHRADDGLSSTRQEQADRLTDIAKRSGGDWNKLTQADKDYLVNTLSHGNEQNARMILMAKVGHFAGGPPQAGKPPSR